MIQLSLWCLVNWLSRIAQWLGGFYLLLAAIAALRESNLPILPLGEKPRTAIYRDAMAVVTVLTAAAMRLVFLSALGAHAPYVVFLPAVMISAIYGGWRAGLLATALSAILANYFWIEPTGQFILKEPADALGLAIFLLSGAMIAWITEVLHRARVRAHKAETQALLAAQREAVAETLRESEHRYRTLFNSMTEGFAIHEIVCDDKGVPCDYRFLDINPAFERLTGLKREEVVGKLKNDIMPDDDPIWVRKYGEVALAGRPVHFDNYAPLLKRHYEVYAYCPAPKQFAVIFADITDRKQSEQALRRSEERWNAAIENMGEGAIIATEAGEVIYWNPAARAMHGFTSVEEGIGPLKETPNTFQLWTPDGCRLLPLEEWPMPRIMRGEKVSHMELRLRRPDQGWEKIVSYSGAMVETAGGERLVYLSVYDLTEQRKAEAALRDSEALLRAVTDNSPDAIYVKDRESRWLMANPAVLRIVDKTAEESLGKTDLEFYADPQIGRAIIDNDQRILTRGLPEAFEEIADAPEGRRTFLSIKAPRRDANGDVIGIIGISRDITERKQAEEALRKSEQEFRALAEAVPQIVWATRPDGWNIYFNQQWMDYTGLTLDESYGHGWITPFHPDDKPRAWDAWQRATQHNETYLLECRLRRADGVYRWWLIHGAPIRDANGEIQKWIGTCTDIEEIKQAEERLRDSEQQFRSLADSIPNLAWWANGDGYITWYNRQWYEYTGTTPEQMEGWGWQRVHDPNHLPHVLERWKASIATGEPFSMEFPLLGRDGQFRWFLTRVLPLKDAGGRVVRWFGTNTDVTEVRQAQQAAEAANEAKSQFLANMSHELRTPMNAILGMIDVALPKATDPKVQDCLQTAKGSADLLLTLLDDLLDSAKIESGKMELESAPFSLRRMLDHITRVLAVRASEKGLAFNCRVPDETPDVVMGDRLRLQQILLNLAGNAIKFTERGDVEIILQAHLHNDEANLEFAVRDTGIGIPPSGQNRLFQPFSQADPSMTRRFGGTGLGLAISKSLVEMMGGSIRVESELGKGSTFYITLRLPLSKEPPFDFEAPVAIPKAACAKLRILLVEDNPANQKLVTYILQDRGHIVEIAGDGQEAIYLTEQNRYDVILMDVQMPGLNGLEATAAIRKREAEMGTETEKGTGSICAPTNAARRCPPQGRSGKLILSPFPRRVPIIAMTAHAMRGDRDRCLAAGMDGYLSKPVNAIEMIGLVESLALGSAPGTQISQSTYTSALTSLQATTVVFDPNEALARCFNSQDMLREMFLCFFDEVDKLFPQMRAAIEKGNLVEVGHLGHRLKGTVVYLGAQQAKEAALRVERFCKSIGGTPAEAEDAINALARECIALKAALSVHPLAPEPEQSD
jgi:PAS domain S-box-containing protein